MKFRSALPKQELNGLNAVHGDAVGHVAKTYLIVGLVRVVESTTLADKTREAKFGLERLEVVPADASPYVADLLETIFEERTGKTPLDLDMPGVADLRKQFRARRGDRPEPTLSREPEALEARVVLDPSVLTPEEQAEAEGVVDAEVVDEADESAAEDADAQAERVDVTGRDITPDERLRLIDALGLDEEAPPRDIALAMQEAAQDAGLELDAWVNDVLNA